MWPKIRKSEVIICRRLCYYSGPAPADCKKTNQRCALCHDKCRFTAVHRDCCTRLWSKTTDASTSAITQGLSGQNYRRRLDGCIVWNAHNTVFGSKKSAICVHAVYFLHSTRHSVTWLNSRWWLGIGCLMSALSAYCQPASDVAENLGRFLVRSLHSKGMTLN